MAVLTNRSGTRMDSVSLFTPMNGMRNRNGYAMGALGQTGDEWDWTYGGAYDQQTAPTQSITTMIRDLLLTGQQWYAQQQIISLNMERSRAGLPPVPYEYFAPSVNVGVSAEMKKMLLIGGGLVLITLIATGALAGRRASRRR